MQIAPNHPALPPTTAQPPATSALMQTARELEVAFLAEMLGHAGLGKPEGDFDGGIGEEQFASFLRREQAELMASRGGIGLAEHLFRAMGGVGA